MIIWMLSQIIPVLQIYQRTFSMLPRKPLPSTIQAKNKGDLFFSLFPFNSTKPKKIPSKNSQAHQGLKKQSERHNNSFKKDKNDVMMKNTKRPSDFIIDENINTQNVVSQPKDLFHKKPPIYFNENQANRNVFGAQAKFFEIKKQNFIELSLSSDEEENKESRLFVDMKKKIKKLSKTKRPVFAQNSMNVLHQNRVLQRDFNEGVKTFNDHEVFLDSEYFIGKIIPQRIDNDADTDDEQIRSGIRRMSQSLRDIVQQNKKQIESVSLSQEKQQLFDTFP